MEKPLIVLSHDPMNQVKSSNHSIVINHLSLDNNTTNPLSANIPSNPSPPKLSPFLLKEKIKMQNKPISKISPSQQFNLKVNPNDKIPDPQIYKINEEDFLLEDTHRTNSKEINDLIQKEQNLNLKLSNFLDNQVFHLRKKLLNKSVINKILFNKYISGEEEPDPSASTRFKGKIVKNLTNRKKVENHSSQKKIGASKSQRSMRNQRGLKYKGFTSGLVSQPSEKRIDFTTHDSNIISQPSNEFISLPAIMNENKASRGKLAFQSENNPNNNPSYAYGMNTNQSGETFQPKNASSSEYYSLKKAESINSSQSGATIEFNQKLDIPFWKMATNTDPKNFKEGISIENNKYQGIHHSGNFGGLKTLDLQKTDIFKAKSALKKINLHIPINSPRSRSINQANLPSHHKTTPFKSLAEFESRYQKKKNPQKEQNNEYFTDIKSVEFRTMEGTTTRLPIKISKHERIKSDIGNIHKGMQLQLHSTQMKKLFPLRSNQNTSVEKTKHFQNDKSHIRLSSQMNMSQNLPHEISEPSIQPKKELPRNLTSLKNTSQIIKRRKQNQIKLTDYTYVDKNGLLIERKVKRPLIVHNHLMSPPESEINPETLQKIDSAFGEKDQFAQLYKQLFPLKKKMPIYMNFTPEKWRNKNAPKIHSVKTSPNNRTDRINKK